MALTPVLGITQVATNQSNKEVTINDAIVALEGAGNATKTLDYSLVSNGAVTLDSVSFTRNFMFKCVKAPSDTTAITLHVPQLLNNEPIQRIFVVYNNSGKGLTVVIDGAAAGSSGATGVVLPDGSPRLIAMDGDNLILASQATTITRFIDLADAPRYYTGKKGLTFAVNQAEDGIEFVEGLTLEGLTDVDTTTNGLSDGEFLRYNASEQKWQSAAVSLVTTFLGLNDVPKAYTGMAGYLLHVNGSANAIEFVNPLSLGGPVTGGGNTNQVLTKNSATDGDYGWHDLPVSLPLAGAAGQYLKKNSNADGDAVWVDLPVVHELPAAGVAGQILIKKTGSDYDVEWGDTLTLSTEYTPAVINSHAFSLLDNQPLALPFAPTVGNALVVAYFSNAALTAAAGWTAISTIGQSPTSSWWIAGGAYAHIVAAGDSQTIEPVAAPGTADAAVVFEIDVRYFKGDLTKLAATLGYRDAGPPEENFTAATMYAVATAHRTGAEPVYTTSGGTTTQVGVTESTAGGNRFAGGVIFAPAPKNTAIDVGLNMGGGTDGVYCFLALPALSTELEEAPADGSNYVRSMKAWKVQGPALPAGGTVGQLLTKHSATAGDATWVDPAPALPAGGQQGQVLSKNSATLGDASWVDLPTSTPLGGAVVIQSVVHDDNGSMSLTMPTQPVEGNWLVALVFSNNANPAANTAAGWEKLGNEATGSGQDATIFAKQVLAGDTATIAPTLTNDGGAGEITVFELAKAAVGSDISAVLTTANTTVNGSSGTIGPIDISGNSTLLFAYTNHGSVPAILTPSIGGSASAPVTNAGAGTLYGSAFSYDALSDGSSLSIAVNLNGGTEGSGAYAFLLFHPLNASFIGEAPNDGKAYARKSKNWSVPLLSDLADVNEATVPTDGQALIWNQATGRWKPGTVAAGGGGSTDTTTIQPFTVDAVGTGASQGVVLPVAGLLVEDVFVFVNGVRFNTSEYTIDGNTLTLTTNANGDAIEIARPAGGTNLASFRGAWGDTAIYTTFTFDGLVGQQLPKNWTATANMAAGSANPFVYVTKPDAAAGVGGVGTQQALKFGNSHVGAGGLNESITIGLVSTAIHNTATIRYYISSENGYDFFRIYLDDNQIFTDSSDHGQWLQTTVNFGAPGAHTLRFAYTKDSSGDVNDDTVYLSEVVLPESGQPYVVGDTVTYLGRTWTCLVPNTSNPPSYSTQDWAPGGVQSVARIVAFATTAPAASEMISMFLADVSMTLPANFTGSVAKCLSYPLGNYVFNVNLGGTTVGTITINSAGVVTFATTSGAPVAIPAGGLIEIVAPATVDTNIANFVATLVALVN